MIKKCSLNVSNQDNFPSMTRIFSDEVERGTKCIFTPMYVKRSVI